MIPCFIMFLIKNLSVSIDDQPIINDLNLQVAPGTIHAIMGPNGSGKSTLAYTLAGHPNYKIERGSIVFNNQNVTKLPPDKRAQAGLFLAFQHPCEIPGVTVSNFLKEAYAAITTTQISVEEFHQLLQKKMKLLNIDPSFAYRNLNDGFSGGEKKRLEMLQLLVLKPKLAILDEIDSGLDIDALKIVAQGLTQARRENPSMSVIIITHYQRILNYIKPDFVHILMNGNIVQSGDATLAHSLEQRGYQQFHGDQATQ